MNIPQKQDKKSDLYYEAYGICHIGKIRDSNQDAIFINNHIIRDEEKEVQGKIPFFRDGVICFAAADGMGGYSDSGMASKIVLEELKNHPPFMDMPGQFTVGDDLKTKEVKKITDRWIHSLHEKLENQSQNSNQMGTTLSVLFIDNKSALFMHTGDTRIYRFFNNQLNQLTRDHTAANLSGNENLPKNILANALGGGAQKAFADIEFIDPKIQSNDIFLICSDGLHGLVSKEEITNNLTEHADNLKNAARALLDMAMNKGGNDNISIILLKIFQEKEQHDYLFGLPRNHKLI